MEDAIKSGLLLAVVGLLLSLIKLLKAFVDVKTDEIYAKIDNENVRNTMDLLDDTVFDVVLQVGQEVADDLKVRSADGKLTNDDIIEIKSLAVTRIKAIMGTEALEFLNTIVGNTNVLIDTKVEAAVKTIKNK